MVDSDETGRDPAPRISARERLEQHAAQILGKARSDAALVLRFAQSEAEGILSRAKERAGAVEAEALQLREEARRELARAQQQSLAIRSEAQRVADGIIRRATQQARTEADAVLKEARLQLAKAVEEMNHLRAAAEAAGAEPVAAGAAQAVAAIGADAVIIDLRSGEAVLDLSGRARLGPVSRPAVAADAAVSRHGSGERETMPAPPVEDASAMTMDELREWVSDLSDENLDALIGSAVECAVQRAINPTVVRAGRYTMLRRAV